MIPSIVQAVGILVTAAGAAMFNPALGLVVAGAGLIVFGLAWERSR